MSAPDPNNTTEPRSDAVSFAIYRWAVADVAGVPIGWWVEGMVHQEVLFASDFRWLRFAVERDRAKLANLFLYRGAFPGRGSVMEAANLGVDLIYLPSAGRFGVDARNPPSGWRLAYASGDAVVLAPSGQAMNEHD